MPSAGSSEREVDQPVKARVRAAVVHPHVDMGAGSEICDAHRGAQRERPVRGPKRLGHEGPAVGAE